MSAKILVSEKMNFEQPFAWIIKIIFKADVFCLPVRCQNQGYHVLFLNQKVFFFWLSYQFACSNLLYLKMWITFTRFPFWIQTDKIIGIIYTLNKIVRDCQDFLNIKVFLDTIFFWVGPFRDLKLLIFGDLSHALEENSEALKRLGYKTYCH